MTPGVVYELLYYRMHLVWATYNLYRTCTSLMRALFATTVAWLGTVTVKVSFEISNFALILTLFWTYFEPWILKTHFGELSPPNSKTDRSRRFFNRFWLSRALRVALVLCYRMVHISAMFVSVKLVSVRIFRPPVYHKSWLSSWRMHGNSALSWTPG